MLNFLFKFKRRSSLFNISQLGRMCRVGAFLLLGVFCISVSADAPAIRNGCPLQDNCPPRERGWFLRICRPQTKAPAVRLEIGIGGMGSSHRYWRDWRENESTEFDLPIDLLHAKEIWIKGVSLENPENDDDEDVSMCVFFNDHVTQAMQFDEDEEHETSRGDDDNNNCECR